MGNLAILKMVAVWPYLLMDRNHFGQTYLDIDSNSYARFRLNSSQRRCDNGENQIFVEGLELFSSGHN